MKTLSARYKKYNSGGNVDFAMGIGQAAGMVGQFADALGPANEYGKKSLTSNLLSNAGSMAAAGSSFGPVGTAVGAGVGLVTGFLQNGKQKKLQDQLRSEEQKNDYQTNMSRAAARISADPASIYGNLAANYYAYGGSVNVGNQQIKGGSATPLSSTAAEFNGPSHNNGGIDIPGVKAEVEGGETSDGNYVFSERLGFAALHKPIAKAIGKIEQKALSPERINSLNLLRKKENNLKLSQEYTKQKLGLN